MHELNTEQVEVLKTLLEADALSKANGLSAEQISLRTGKLASDLLNILHDLYEIHLVICGVNDDDPSGQLHSISEAPWWLLPDALDCIKQSDNNP